MLKRVPLRISLVLAVGLLTLSLTAIVSARPAGGGGGKGGGSATPTATLAADCNPCAAGSVVGLAGTGYDGNQPSAQVRVALDSAAIPVNADGSVAFGWYFSAPGSHSVSVYQWGKGGKLVLKAQTTVNVE
jgi:hypothetical protein